MEITEVEGKYARDIEEYAHMQTAAQEILETYGKQIALDTADKKSTKILGITIGFRSGRAKLSLLEGFDWDAVQAKVKDLFPRYVRRVEQLEKDKLLKDLASEPEKLESVGLAVEQSNSFYVKLD